MLVIIGCSGLLSSSIAVTNHVRKDLQTCIKFSQTVSSQSQAFISDDAAADTELELLWVGQLEAGCVKWTGTDWHGRHGHDGAPCGIAGGAD